MIFASVDCGSCFAGIATARISTGLAESGVSGVVGWDEGSFAGAGDQGVAEPGFQVVVELA
ncbi:MAG TPA: hypothetical protein VFI46_15550, partial [Jiangellaceae bacterium]|nr:hypothetical protein [Jiangellaceae bacterium]